MNEINEIWLAIEGLQESITDIDERLIEVEKHSHPPVKWEAEIGELKELVATLDKKLAELQDNDDRDGGLDTRNCASS